MAGTVTITRETIFVNNIHKRRVITLAWVADAAAATVPSTTIPASTYGITGYYFYSAETDPGAVAPTDNYDIVINDANGLDITGGMLANRSSTVTQMVNIGLAAHGYPVIRGDLTFVLTGNAINSATGTAILIFSTD